MKKEFAFFILILILSGCIGQAPTPQTTETPAPTTITLAPTMTTPTMTSLPPKTTASPMTVPPTTSPPTPPKDYNSIMRDLEKNFPKLALELKELPEFKGNPSESDLEALNDIYYLWKNATNPEVKEAFDLMIKGGTPDQKDFTYVVPTYNTELQVLFWLAQQNEFHHNDTLAQTIAMVNGLWVTMGDDEVRKAVKKDTNDLLNYFRETNEWQRERGYYLLEDFPLEAKVALAWTGNDNANHGWENLLDHTNNSLDIDVYMWINIRISYLRSIRKLLLREFSIVKDVRQNVETIENFFYIHGHNWDFNESMEKKVSIKGILYPARNLNNPNFQFENFLKTGKGIGVCEDNMTMIGNFLKSLGVTSNPVMHYWKFNNSFSGHTYNIYYDPFTQSWLAHRIQIDAILSDPPEGSLINFYIFQPPVYQDSYLQVQSYEFTGDPITDSYFSMTDISKSEIYELFIKGLSTSQMKQWLLYS